MVSFLYALQTPLTEAQLIPIIYQITSSLALLHYTKTLHFRICADNFILIRDQDGRLAVRTAGLYGALPLTPKHDKSDSLTYDWTLNEAPMESLSLERGLASFYCNPVVYPLRD